MLTTMRGYAAAGKYREALIIGQNLFANNTADTDVFREYFSVLWSLVSTLDNIEDKKHYFQMLSSTLAAYSTAVMLNDDVVEFIKSKEDELSLLYKTIQEDEQNLQREIMKRKILDNDRIINEITVTIQKIASVKEKNTFDKLLGYLQQKDAELEKEFLTDRQKQQYDLLTKECSQTVNSKLRRFEHESNVAYNLQAIDAYEKVFNFFKNGNGIENHEEIISNFFSYDASRLFNETLTYYNHVYSFVLSQLKDDEKYVLTKAAVHSELLRKA